MTTTRNTISVTRHIDGAIISGLATHQPAESFSNSWMCVVSQAGKELDRRYSSDPWAELQDMIQLATT